MVSRRVGYRGRRIREYSQPLHLVGQAADYFSPHRVVAKKHIKPGNISGSRSGLAGAWGAVGIAFIAYALGVDRAIVVAHAALRLSLAAARGVVGIAFIACAALPCRAMVVAHAAFGLSLAAAWGAHLVAGNAYAVLPQLTQAVVAHNALGWHLACARSARLRAYADLACRALIVVAMADEVTSSRLQVLWIVSAYAGMAVRAPIVAADAAFGLA